jgi:hypothetical protein
MSLTCGLSPRARRFLLNQAMIEKTGPQLLKVPVAAAGKKSRP